ncbi:unnamed protein product [Schistosoma rodhaini]|nr:unnamed protein product [Schistosoma rodhaini]
MMRCGLTMNSMIESLSPVQCRCHNPCEAISYSVESITQALKSPLLFTHSLNLFNKINQTNFELNNNFQLSTDQQQFNDKITSKNQKSATVSDDISDYDPNSNNHKNPKDLKLNQPEQFLPIYRKEIWNGLLLQTWAFLREANRTAFEQLRQLSRLLQSLNLDLQTVERAFYKVHRKHRLNLEAHDLMIWDSGRLSTNKHSSSDQSNGSCMDSEEHSRMLERVSHLGKEFVRLFRQSILFRDITLVPGLDFHIHLVRLFFLNVVDELDHLANQSLHNDLFSDVTMLDLQRKTHQCKQTNNDLVYNDTSWKNQLEQSQLIVAGEDITRLQAVLLATDSQFKQLRTVFSKLVLDNRELIETVPIKRASLNTKPDSLISTEEGLVSVTIQLTRDKNRLIRLESVQAIYSPIAELLDLIVSGLLLAFLSIFLLNICVSHPNNSDSCYSECCCCCSTLVNKSTNSKSCESPKLATHTTLPTSSYINCNTDSGSSSKRLPKLNTISYRNYSDLVPTDILQKKPTMSSVYLCDSHQQDGVPISSKCIITGLPITSNKPCAKCFGENCRHNFNMCPNESSQYMTYNLPTLLGSSVTLPKWDNKVLQLDMDGFNCMDASEHSATECDGEQSHANTNHHYLCHQQQSLPRQRQQLNHQQNSVNESCISFCDCPYSMEDNTRTDSASCLNSNKLLFCNNHLNTGRNCSSIRKPTDINYSKNEMLNCLIITPQQQDTTTFNEVTPNIVTTHQLPFSVDLLQSSQLLDNRTTLSVNTSH